MPEFEIVKRGDNTFVGYTQEDHKRYAAYLAKCDGMEPGEFMRLKVVYPRSLVFHNRFMKMLRFAFEQWEPEKARKRLTYKGVPIEKDFEAFRKDTLILAGFYIARYDARGRVKLDAKSISFDNMEDDEFRTVYKPVYEVLYRRIFENKRGYTRDELDLVLAEFERFQPT